MSSCFCCVADDLRAQKKCTLVFWDAFMRDYFSENAVMRLNLWKNNQTSECKASVWLSYAIPICRVQKC